MFRPLSRRGKPADPVFDGPHEGVPTWLRQTLMDWLAEQFRSTRSTEYSDVSRAKVQAIQRDLKLEITWGNGTDGAWGHLSRQLWEDEDLWLDVLDWACHRTKEPMHLAMLNAVLEQGGSCWQVEPNADGTGRLERRIDATSAQAAKTAAPSGARAAVHLADAWTTTYGRSPNPSHAYGEAVRAVEAAAQPVVSPANASATLGTMIRDMEAKPSKWILALQPSSGAPIEKVIGMMRLLWTSQLDRHGTSDPGVPLTVSQPEAEAAVHLAGALVHWFSSGAVKRV